MNELLELVGNLQDCPWSKWRPATLRFCEAQRCEWIATPAEFWSNLAYFIIAGVLLNQGLREGKGIRSIPFRFGVYAFIVGCCSSIFHASHTFVFETFDLAAMYFLGTELILQNLQRLGWLRFPSPLPLASLIFLGALLLLLGTTGTPRLWVFSGLVTIAAFFEVLIFIRYRRLKLEIDYSSLVLSWILFGISYGFWFVDYTGLVCNRENHLWSGHALWHIANSGCFLTLSRFYSSCRKTRPSVR